MSIELKSVHIEEKQALRRLLAQYLAELSTYGDVDQTYPYFEAYWQEGERRWPYHLLLSGEIIGFALVNTFSPSGRGTDFSIAEFYIVPQARGLGSGREAARIVMQTHPGIWELSVLSLNLPVRKFWPRAIAAASAHDVENIAQADEIIYRFLIK